VVTETLLAKEDILGGPDTPERKSSLDIGGDIDKVFSKQGVLSGIYESLNKKEPFSIPALMRVIATI
jgi:hypothetical protein